MPIYVLTSRPFRSALITSLMLVALKVSDHNPAAAVSDALLKEPDSTIAATWWPPLRNVWTPVGVKSHPIRFNVLYNGTIVADPHPLKQIITTPIKQYLNQYDGLGVQLTFTTSEDGSFPPVRTQPYQLSSMPDGGIGLQGWHDQAAPVLWTRWPVNTKFGNSGVVLREDIFARIHKSQPVKSGKEPLYGWIRLTVEHVDPLDAPKETVMMVHLGNAQQIQRSMFHEENLVVNPEASIYPRSLTREAFTSGTVSGCRLVEPDGKIRLIAMTATGSALLEERTSGTKDYYLKLTLPSVKGNSVDLLVPMLPGDPEEVATEANVGFDQALLENNIYWSKKPATAAVFDTPEPKVNAAVRRLTELAQVVTETNPETGERAFLTGSWNYDTLWPTPACMSAHMLLDLLGYHEFVADHLEIFYKTQGSAKAPGDAYHLHPGYFGAPRQLSSVDWLTDHGSILHSIALNGLLSGDQKVINHWLEPLLEACRFIRDSRAQTNHEGVHGVLPPAVASDASVPLQAVWNIAWNYKGLTTAASLLERIQHPEAESINKEAQDYKDAFVAAYRNHCSRAEQWVDSSGTSRTIVPTSLWGPQHRNHPFFLDTGPMVLPYAGLLAGDDPLIADSIAYYREGPNTKLYDPRGNMHQRPVLLHEVSSCEPCYSFNILCSWQAGDRSNFLEGMYSLLASSLSDQTFSGCEHRHGIYGLPAPGALMFYAMRLAVIDDEIEPGSLHLLRMAPMAWIKDDYQTRFEKMPTRFGPVSLKLQLDPTKTTLNVEWEPQFRNKPDAVILHIPPIESFKSVLVNSRTYNVTPGETITLDVHTRSAQ